MKTKSIPVLIFCLALSGCSTMKESVLLGAGTMGAVGTGIWCRCWKQCQKRTSGSRPWRRVRRSHGIHGVQR